MYKKGVLLLLGRIMEKNKKNKKMKSKELKKIAGGTTAWGAPRPRWP